MLAVKALVCRRQWGGVWGGDVPSPLKKGRNFFNFFWFSVFQKILCSGQRGGASPSGPPLNTPLLVCVQLDDQFRSVNVTSAQSVQLCDVVVWHLSRSFTRRRRSLTYLLSSSFPPAAKNHNPSQVLDISARCSSLL